MAWSHTALSSDEQANLAADNLLLGALHACTEIGRSGATSRWVASATGTSTDTDNTDADKPVSRAGDLFGHLRTRPDSSETAHTLVLDLGASAPAFDGILIWGHNFADLDADLSIAVEIADNGAFSTNKQEIATVDPGADDDRLVLLDLKHTGTDPLRYSGVEWMRLIFTIDGATSFKPELSEVWPFRRRQFESNFLRGFDPDKSVSDAVAHTARSGVKSKSTRYKGKAVLDGQLIADGTSEIQTVTDFWRDSQEGNEHFVCIPQPSSHPERAFVVDTDGALNKPHIAQDFARWQFSAEEQRPFVSAEREASS